MVFFAVAVVLGVVVVVVAAATFSPWPFEAAAVGIGLACGSLAVLATRDALVGVFAAAVPLLALLVAKTIKQTLDEGTAARRAARPRRNRPPARDERERRAA